METTWQLDAILAHTPGTVVLKGGTRSGKTFAGLQYWIGRLTNESGSILSIARKYRESHRTAALRDFEIIMRETGAWRDSSWHKGDFVYEFDSGSILEWIGMDVEEKKMGAARDYLWLNEATEFKQSEYFHLNMRTRGDTRMFDLNPKVDRRHWIPSWIMQQPGVTVISSTYKDNRFLPKAQIEAIESIREKDPLFWAVYGQGDFVSLVGNIYANWTETNAIPAGLPTVYGVDFGMTDPMAVVEVARDGDLLYVKERLYRTGMTNSDLIAWLKAEGITGPLYCESAEPDRILEMQRAGLNAIPADKGPGSIRIGIDFGRRHQLRLIGANLVNEISQYKWREDRQGNVMEGEPVDYLNHLLDAARYAWWTRWGQPSGPLEIVSLGGRTFKGRAAW